MTEYGQGSVAVSPSTWTLPRDGTSCIRIPHAIHMFQWTDLLHRSLDLYAGKEPLGKVTR